MSIKCLLINGSSQGATGNSARLLTHFKKFAGDFEYRELNLVDEPEFEKLLPQLAWAEAIVFTTGTYWDSWGWPLQRFLESATETEGTSIWLGKPAAVLVTMHSVGGKGVLSRLQGVLNTFGATIPPMSGVVISAIGQVALQCGEHELTDDIWQTEDLQIVAANLVCVAEGRHDFRSWLVDRAAFRKIWLEP